MQRSSMELTHLNCHAQQKYVVVGNYANLNVFPFITWILDPPEFRCSGCPLSSMSNPWPALRSAVSGSSCTVRRLLLAATKGDGAINMMCSREQTSTASGVVFWPHIPRSCEKAFSAQSWSNLAVIT